MQEAKSKNIRSKFYFILCFMLSGFGLSAQYSQEMVITDSVKYSILQNVELNTHLLSSPTQKVDRNNMPIFCKWELDIQDKTIIPVKFRLGSQDYVDYLEQKPNSNPIKK